MGIELYLVFAIQAVSLLVFIISAFRWLFALRRAAVTKSGSTFPGLGETLDAFRTGLTDPRHARSRAAVALSALTLLSTSFIVPLLMRA